MAKKFLVPIVLPADPAAPMEAATKQYVDARPTGDEVFIGASDPGTAVGYELWFDSDAGSPVAPGVGLPPGGTTGQALTKKSATDYDAQWSTLLLPGAEIFHSEITANVRFTVNSEATAAVIVSSPSVVYDGTPIMLEFFAPGVYPPGVVNGMLMLNLWDGNTDLGYWGDTYNPAANVNIRPALLKRRLVPSAGAHTYSVRGWVNGTSNAGTVEAGTGVAGGYAPAYLRATRV